MSHIRRLVPTIAALTLATSLGACSVEDSHRAKNAPAQLIGLSEVDLASCIGAPDNHATYGNVNVDTWKFSSSSSSSMTIPIVGGIGMSNGGNCNATFRIENGRVARVIYSGEKNATLAPDAYCAPILRSCLDWLAANPQPRHLPLPAQAGDVPALRRVGGPDAQAAEPATIAAGTGTRQPGAAAATGNGASAGNPVGTGAP